MKEIIMETTLKVLYPDGKYIVPEDFEPKTTKDGINYVVKETNYEDRDKV